MAITRIAKGTAQDKTARTSWTPLSSISIGTGSLLIVVDVNDVATVPSSVTWNGINLIRDAVGSGLGVTVWSLNVLVGATGNIVINYPLAAIAKSMFATEVTGMVDPILDKLSAATGTSTSPNSNATQTTIAVDEFLLGVVGTAGPNGDNAGMWGSSTNNAGQRLGTTGNPAAGNRTISEGFAIQSSLGAMTASKSGITSRQWDCIIVTYKATLFTQWERSPLRGAFRGFVE